MQTLEAPKTEWPEGKNPILTVMREGFDPYDAWASTMGWWFALADIHVDLDIPVPAEWEFRQAAGGSDDDTYEYQDIMALLDPEAYVHQALTRGQLREHVEHAGRVIHRYAMQLELAGERY